MQLALTTGQIGHGYGRAHELLPQSIQAAQRAYTTLTWQTQAYGYERTLG